MKSSSTIVLEAHEITKSYNEKRVLDNFSLEISSSDFFVLMGPNGSGKSTLMSILAGTNPMDRGKVMILGHDISHDELKARQHIGYVPQQHFCSDFLTGRENLQYFADLLGLSKSQAKKRIPQLLQMMGLEDDADRNVREYSGGMKKKLEVATALLGDAQILFLDEPSTGLDPNARKEFLMLLKSINEQGTAILLVTHIGEDAEIANRVGFMLEGRIVAEGTPQKLKEMSGVKSSIILDVIPRTDELLLLLGGISNDCIVIERNESIELSCEEPNEMVPLIMDKLQRSGFNMRSIETQPPSLEDIFYSLTACPIGGEVA
ncbi:ABC transporter ATP-binding protein [Candidatus Thorarchaeota archaeon]|nr:MAG: ABC transporter ATP-binding protein [Candidatus Thorarchaeota archaeon]